MVSLLLVLLSVVAAVLPVALLLGAVWWMDRYDREPVWLLLLTFAWGGLVATLLSLFGNTSASVVLGMVLGGDVAAQLTPVLVAPLVEEPTKAAVLFLVLLSRNFDNTTDGFVYGAATGLGFAMTENFLYFATVAQSAGADPVAGALAWGQTVLVRATYCATMHATASACVGAALGWARFRGRWAWLVALPGGFGAAFAVHGLWNGLLTADEVLGTGGLLTAANLAVFPLELLTMLGVFQLCLLREQAVLRKELREEALAGVLPAEHVEPLTSFLRRGGPWLAPTISRKAYLRAATTLGLRRFQERRTTGARKQRYSRDVARLRLEVRGLLGQT